MKTPVITNAEAIRMVRVLLQSIEDLENGAQNSRDIAWLRQQHDYVVSTLSGLVQRVADLEARVADHQLWLEPLPADEDPAPADEPEPEPPVPMTGQPRKKPAREPATASS